MTEPTSDATTTEEVQGDAPIEQDTSGMTFHEVTGLPEDTPSFDLTGEVNTTQLTAELTAAGATNVVIKMPESYLDTGVLDPADPIKVYVEGGTKKKIQDAVTAHTPDPQYGMSDDQKAQAAAIAKVQDTSVEVTTEDLRAALSALLSPAQAADAGVPA